MANDPQPSGFITARRAFDLYREAWDDGDAGVLDVRTRDHLVRFRDAFADRELTAKVWLPNPSGEHTIPDQLWTVEGFPERVFLADDVSQHSAKEWTPYRGRTVFVGETDFRRWLDHNRRQPRPDPADFPDPSVEPVWTLTMVLAWIAKRDVEAVRWQMDGWREAWGIPPSFVGEGSVIMGDGGEESHVTAFWSQAAFDELKRACIESPPQVVATAVDDYSGEPTELSRADWIHGQEQLDRKLRSQWVVGRHVYSHLRFDRAEVLRAWPASSGAATTAAPARTGAPGRPSSMQLILAEFERRAATEPPAIESSLRGQARVLQKWFIETETAGPRPTEKTIENRLRGPYRAAISRLASP